MTGVVRAIGYLRRDPNLCAQRLLTLDDVGRDVLREHLDEERLADHDLLDRLLEELREAGHVHALLRRVEVDRALDVGRDLLLVVAVPDPDRLAHAGDPGAREPERNLGHGSLEVVFEQT